MNTKCKICDCGFEIGQADKDFYARIQVPLPTQCPECRRVQRMCFRNERTLYKRKSDAPGATQEILSIFSPDSDQVVYDHASWWGDSWDALSYGQKIDFNQPFFSQLKKLWRMVPDMALLNINPVNSDYCSITEGNKNCYLVVGGDFNEDVSYSSFVFNCRDSLDMHWVSKSEFSYETIDCNSCARLRYSRQCESCFDSSFLFNCKNCHDCFGGVNLRNASYVFFNEQLSKEEYETKMQEIDLSSYRQIEEFKKRFEEMIPLYPKKYARVLRSVHSTGDNLEGAKNCKECFEVFEGAEDCAYIWLAYSPVKDCYDCDHFGKNSQDSYQCSTIYPGNRVLFSRFIFESHDVAYSYNCHNCSNLFGCVGLRNKSYCIFNTQYSKEEYEECVPKVIKHMQEKPYVDSLGREYVYGDFFPTDISPFAYNETVAQELSPLSEGEAKARGFLWRSRPAREYSISITAENLPDSLDYIGENILQETIGCAHSEQCSHQCTKAFKITRAELDFYKRMSIPLPRLCYNCRYYERIAKRNPLELWDAVCACSGVKSENGLYKNGVPHAHGEVPCGVTFKTSCNPAKDSFVYCEACYQAEVS